MKRAKTGGKPATDGGATVRISISFSHSIYESLVKVAKDKRVSLAWVVRDAVDQYITVEAEDEKGRANNETSVRKVRRRS